MLQWRLWVDWRNDTDIDYRCQANEERIAVSEVAQLDTLVFRSVNSTLSPSLDYLPTIFIFFRNISYWSFKQ